MGIFILGGVVFIVAFILFKISAYRKTKANEQWRKLALVGVVDYLVLVAGTLGTGILFMTIYSSAHG
jgi:multisubunit Na+/H+ antiporter MnhB subunit